MACMGGDDTESEPSFEEIEVELREHRENILQVYMSHDSDVFDSSELRVIAGVPEGSIKFHLDKLKDWGLIEDLDERVRPAHGGGSDAKQWRLTERGESFTEEFVVYVPPGDVDELARRLVDLERRLDAMQEAHESEVAEIKDEMNARLDRIEKAVTGGQPNGQR